MHCTLINKRHNRAQATYNLQHKIKQTFNKHRIEKNDENGQSFSGFKLSAARAFGAGGSAAGSTLFDQGQQLPLLMELFGVRAASDAVSVNEDSRYLSTQIMSQNVVVVKINCYITKSASRIRVFIIFQPFWQYDTIDHDVQSTLKYLNNYQIVINILY